MTQSDEGDHSHKVRVGKPVQVPVYNCHVYLSGPDEQGLFAARCSTLPEVQTVGSSQREVLQSMVAAFKAAVTRYLAADQPIPFLTEPLTKEPGEQERWIAVHL